MLHTEVKSNPNAVAEIEINYSTKGFSISDNCGGIDYQMAKSEIFNFGHDADYHENSKYQLGVYGIGMKRAIFKIGDYFKVESQSKVDGFCTEVDSLKDWVEHDSSIDDWTFPIKKLDKAKSKSAAGTKVTIKKLRKEVQSIFEDDTFHKRIISDIAKTYALFLNRYVNVTVNNEMVHPISIPFGGSDELKPAYKKNSYNGVEVHLMASIAKKGEKGDWKAESAGWYVACNGRLVLTANKDELTGWGGGTLPSFVSKFRPFVGLALFQSENPYSLPWTTTKRGLNRESHIYQKVRNEMQLISRPVISFLNKMYPDEPKEAVAHREAAEKIQEISIQKLSNTERIFEVNPEVLKRVKDTVRVQYSAKLSEIEKIRKHLNNPKITYSKIGLLTFHEYLIRENL